MIRHFYEQKLFIKSLQPCFDIRYSKSNKPETTVTGPRISVNFCLVKFLIKDFINKLFPTFAGPTRATTTGGGSSGVRSTSGK